MATAADQGVSSTIAAANAALERALPADTTDEDDARRGFVAALSPGAIRSEHGRVVWDADAYRDLLAQARPDSVNPSLWRQSGLVALQGLYEVVPGLYQVRGLDLSNMTLVEGDEGVLVIDPLISTECAAAALGLYRAHRGDRPVTGVIYTHSHVDHFAGALGVVSQEDVSSGRVPVLAPGGFLDHAVSENVYAGTAMARRAVYMYGAALSKGPRGQLGAGLGMTNSTGTTTLVPPTHSVTATGQEEHLDGVHMIFQLTPGTEAPSEMNFFFPGLGALCMAENATHNLHNVQTLRGAPVRDARAWAAYLTESIELFGDRAEVVFASHHWPTWGRERIVQFLSLQRDLYAYQHDQTLRLLNQGRTAAEIAEEFELPPALEQAWHARGYYGSVSHNVKAIYHRYLGWFDGNPAHLWNHPPEQAGRRYVAAVGGADRLLEVARQAYDDGDFRWVAELTSHLVFAEPDNAAARELEADALEQLGFGAENGTWRNFFLMGAQELRHGSVGTPVSGVSPGLLAGLTLAQVFDGLAIRVDGPRAAEVRVLLDWTFTDSGERYRTLLANGVLTHRAQLLSGAAADAHVHTTRSALLRLLGGAAPGDLRGSGDLETDGDAGALDRLLGVLDAPDPDFAIVTP